MLSASIVVSPYIGPMVGSFIAWRTSWRWSYWVLTMLTGFILVIVILFLDETYYPRASIRKGYRVKKPAQSHIMRIVGVEQRRRGLMELPMLQAALRPFLAGLKPPVILLALYYCLNFGWVVGKSISALSTPQANKANVHAQESTRRLDSGSKRSTIST